MGVQSHLKPVDTIGLGVNPVSPLEMASAYATVAAHGVYRPPYAIASVRFADGRDDHSWQPGHGRQVIPAAVADEVTRVLEEVIAHSIDTNPNSRSITGCGVTGLLHVSPPSFDRASRMRRPFAVFTRHCAKTLRPETATEG